MAKINVGAATESEMKEKKARVEDALHATRAAVEEGILPGGGVALLRAVRRGSSPTASRHDEEIGYNIIVRACRVADHADRRERRPGRRRRRRARSPRARATSATTPCKDEYADLVKAGIIDPTKVTRSALQNAASVAPCC